MVITTKILKCRDVPDYKKVFIRELVRKELFIEGLPLLILEKDFDHVCFEKDVGGVEKGRFGVRRASRILVIRDVCKGRIPMAEGKER